MYICEKTISFEAQLAPSNDICKVMELEVVCMYRYLYVYLICVLVWENDFFYSAIGGIKWHPQSDGAQSSIYVYVFIYIECAYMYERMISFEAQLAASDVAFAKQCSSK